MAQLAAAMVAGLTLRFILAETSWAPVAIGTPALADGIGPLCGIAIEAILTVLLVVAVFGPAIDRRTPRIGGLATGWPWPTS